MPEPATLDDLIAFWDSGDGRPYKGQLIDYADYAQAPSLGCMCAQGQVLHKLGGWEIDRLRNAKQAEADVETARLLGISRAHAILLRQVNDTQDGAPSVVLTDPAKVLGSEWARVLAFWRHLDTLDDADWQKVFAAGAAAWAAAREAARAAAGAAAGAAAREAAWAASRAAARAAAGAAAWAAVREAAWAAAGDAAGDAAWVAAGASNEIQGAAIMRERGQPFLFLPMFGFADPEAIPMTEA